MLSQEEVINIYILNCQSANLSLEGDIQEYYGITKSPFDQFKYEISWKNIPISHLKVIPATENHPSTRPGQEENWNDAVSGHFLHTSKANTWMMSDEGRPGVSPKPRCEPMNQWLSSRPPRRLALWDERDKQERIQSHQCSKTCDKTKTIPLRMSNYILCEPNYIL